MFSYFDTFSRPYWLLALFGVAWLFYKFWINQNKHYANVKLSDLKGLEGFSNLRTRLRRFLPLVWPLAMAMMIVALARPQKTVSAAANLGEGIDMILAMDISTSMLAKDFDPDRITVSKQLADEFISNRPVADRLGLVIFSGEAATVCPLTTDHSSLRQMISQLEVGILVDKTAIGMGLAMAVNRIKDSDSRSKIVILLTDGKNTTGYIEPETAADIAAGLGVRVYTIAIGTIGEALSPVGQLGDGSYVFEYEQVSIDENLLESIAQKTGGKYYRAKKAEDLKAVYANIDKLEKTLRQVDAVKTMKDQFHPWLWAAVLLIVAEFILRTTVFGPIN
jgi:Ca-activated chloride channel homolog